MSQLVCLLKHYSRARPAAPAQQGRAGITRQRPSLERAGWSYSLCAGGIGVPGLAAAVGLLAAAVAAGDGVGALRRKHLATRLARLRLGLHPPPQPGPLVGLQALVLTQPLTHSLVDAGTAQDDVLPLPGQGLAVCSKLHLEEATGRLQYPACSAWLNTLDHAWCFSGSGSGERLHVSR